MIVVTGAAGFIASYLAEVLNEQGRTNLILVDDFSTEAKKNNWVKLGF
jgi:ADP-L-glycero-D-manno-heptose 6-epimerase